MTIAFIIYLVGLLGSLKAVTLILAIPSFAYMLAQCIRRVNFSEVHRLPYNEAEEDLRLRINKTLKNCIVWTSIFVTLNAIIPKEKTAWMMLGGYITQTVYESEDGQKYRKLIMQKIDEAIGETAKAAQGAKP